jgi:signal transduction histidine kinase
MSAKNSRDTDLMRLRAVAEALLVSRETSEASWEKGLDEIFQELQVYQIELELQNEELSIANEDLEWQRLRFTNLYELAPIGYFIVTKTGMISEVNAAAVELLDTGRAYIAGRLFHHFVDSESSDTFYLFFHRLITSKEKDGCTLKLVARGGRQFHARLEGIYVHGIDQCYLAVLDIDEIIEIRGKLAETNERLQLAMEASRAGTWELNPETMAFKFDDLGYRFCQVNENLFGGDYNSLLHLVHPDDRSMVDFQFRTAFNTTKKLDLVCRLANPENQNCFAGLRGHMLRRGDGREVLIGIIMDYTEKKRLEAEAEHMRTEHQREINAAVLLAEENERKRMSEALHDSIGQLLYGVKLQVDHLHDTGQSHVIKQVNELLDTAIRETRNLSFELSPAILVDFGLKDALEELARRLSMPNFQVVPHVTGLAGRLDLTLETYIFRIVQELINNCMKHANATSVQINIIKNKKIIIEVIDNGQGFSVKTTGKPKGTGFSSIRNRISVYNGSFHVDSEPGKGTRVKVVLNL